MQLLDNYLNYIKNFTQNVNTLSGESSVFTTVRVLASKLKASSILTQSNGKIAFQSDFFLGNTLALTFIQDFLIF